MLRTINARNVEKLIADLKERGMTVNDVDDIAALRQKVKPVHDELRADIGADLMDDTLAAAAE